jgi:hypothetical protein
MPGRRMSWWRAAPSRSNARVGRAVPQMAGGQVPSPKAR